MKETIEFSHDDVVKYYCKDALPTDLIDVIPRINTELAWQMRILETWEQHFQDQQIPYAITERTMRRSKQHRLKKYRALWKPTGGSK